MGKKAFVHSEFRYKDRLTCICGSSLKKGNTQLLFKHAWGAIRFLRCGVCSSWCQSPQIDSSSLASWYDSDQYQGSAQQGGTAYKNYEADEAQRYKEAQKRFRYDIEPCLKLRPSSILEIGCASGTLLAAAKDLGYRVDGVDLSPRFSEQAKRLNGLDVRIGNVLDLPEQKKYDAVLIFGAVSNFTDLGKIFKKIRRLVHRESKLFINFPDSSSWIAKLYAEKIWMFAPSVITYASTRGLVSCAQKAGWQIEIERIDWQQPSFRKLFKHTKFSAVLPSILTKKLERFLFPFRIPIPGVRFLRLSQIAKSVLS